MLTVRNAQLEAELAGEACNERLHELEQAMADVKAENARLQVRTQFSKAPCYTPGDASPVCCKYMYSLSAACLWARIISCRAAYVKDMESRMSL